MSDNLALAVFFACALSCSLTVVFFDTFALPAVKALWAWLQSSDDPFSDAAYGDEPLVSADHIKAVHAEGDTL